MVRYYLSNDNHDGKVLFNLIHVIVGYACHS